MRIIGLLIASIVGLTAVADFSWSQQRPRDSELVPTSPPRIALATELATRAQIPIATALTDLVTKSASDNFMSSIDARRDLEIQGWRQTGTVPAIHKPASDAGPADNAVSNRRDEFLAGILPYWTNEFTRAVNKGYTPRPVEFDPRYQSNIAVLSEYREPRSSGAAGNERIWHGIPVLPQSDAFLDAVAIVGHNKICSGNLIQSDLVITAAHCYCGGVHEEVLIGQSIISPIERIPVVKEQSRSFIPCDELNKDIASGDVALLRLQRETNVPPRRIADIATLRSAASVRAIGFGKTEKNSIGVKYQVNIVIASYQCDGSALTGIPDSQVYRCRPTHELVAAGLNRDTCGGDSGGPIYLFGPDANTYLVGVTSRAVDPSGRCGPGGIYVVLSAPPIHAWLTTLGALKR